jgi:hypothetical protein
MDGRRPVRREFGVVKRLEALKLVATRLGFPEQLRLVLAEPRLANYIWSPWRRVWTGAMVTHRSFDAGWHLFRDALYTHRIGRWANLAQQAKVPEPAAEDWSIWTNEFSIDDIKRLKALSIIDVHALAQIYPLNRLTRLLSLWLVDRPIASNHEVRGWRWTAASLALMGEALGLRRVVNHFGPVDVMTGVNEVLQRYAVDGKGEDFAKDVRALECNLSLVVIAAVRADCPRPLSFLVRMLPNTPLSQLQGIRSGWVTLAPIALAYNRQAELVNEFNTELLNRSEKYPL